MTDRYRGQWHATPRGPEPAAEEPPQPGTFQVGRLRITATRVTIAVALVGSAIFMAYAITVRDPDQIPMLATGAGVLGVVFAGLAVMGAVESYRAALVGRGGRSLATALLGGVAALVAFGCFAGAIVLAMVWQNR
jgi:hypothetical protein